MGKLVTGHPLYDNRPVTLVVTTSDILPWRARPCQFAVLQQRRFMILGSAMNIEPANQPLVADLIAGFRHSG